jgi:hypothetical protein
MAIDPKLEEEIWRYASSPSLRRPRADEVVAAGLVLAAGHQRCGSDIVAQAIGKRLSRRKAPIEALQDCNGAAGLSCSQIGAPARAHAGGEANARAFANRRGAATYFPLVDQFVLMWIAIPNRARCLADRSRDRRFGLTNAGPTDRVIERNRLAAKTGTAGP